MYYDSNIEPLETRISKFLSTTCIVVLFNKSISNYLNALYCCSICARRRSMETTDRAVIIFQGYYLLFDLIKFNVQIYIKNCQNMNIISTRTIINSN